MREINNHQWACADDFHSSFDEHGYQQGFLGTNREKNYCKTRYERRTDTFNVNNMGKPRIITKSYTQFGVESYEGQSIEDRCKKLVETGEPIKDTSPLIYTPKDKGVMPQYDVRTDKWEIAQDAMDRVNRERIAKGQQPPSERENKKDTAQGGALENAGQPT